jgi:signal transduction histidine kinase
MILMIRSCAVGTSKGVSFLLCEGAFLLKRTMVDDVFGDGLEWGKAIYDIRARRILFGRHPPSLGPDMEDFERRLAASLASLAREGRKMNSRGMLEESPDSSLLVFAEMEPLSGWVVADYSIGMPSFGEKPLRIHMMAAMVSMLLGIVAMLFMLDIQLNHPLKRLMRAGLSLQAGNFDYRSGSRREDEIGVVENIFDQTAERLKILYGNLRRTIEEKDDALKKVKRIEKEKRDFFNALSHELKSPIHSIINFSRFGMSSSQAPNKDYFEKSYESAIRLLGIIEELLQIARIESSPRGEVGEFCLRECVQDSAWRLAGQAQAKKVKFDMRFKPDDVKLPIVADKKQMEILLSNIIGNAVKYTESGSAVSISCERRGDNYSIKVSDEGPGVPEKEMDKLFQEFRRLSGSKDGGSGLGLYISRKIAEMHGGTIYASNNPDKGICFCITLSVRNEEKRRSEDTCR